MISEATPAAVSAPCVSFNIRNKKNKCEQQEDDPKPVDIQHAKAIESQCQAYHTGKTGCPTTWAGDLYNDRLNANGHEQKDHIWIGKDGQDLFYERRFYSHYLCICCMQGAFSFRELNAIPIQLAKQIIQIHCNKIHQANL